MPSEVLCCCYDMPKCDNSATLRVTERQLRRMTDVVRELPGWLAGCPRWSGDNFVILNQHSAVYFKVSSTFVTIY